MKPRVLIVDDNEETLELLRASLNGQPFDVTFCAAGVEALYLIFGALREGWCYDALLLDCAMPYFDAFTTAKIIRMAESTGVVPCASKIAVFTAYTQTVEHSTLMKESRIDKYFRKPHDLVGLGRVLADWLECEVHSTDAGC
jgi:CheY-like chemotaxis protein